MLDINQVNNNFYCCFRKELWRNQPDKIDGPGVARRRTNLHVWCWQHRAARVGDL